MWDFGEAYDLLDPLGRPAPFRNWVEQGYLTTSGVFVETVDDSGPRITLKSGRYTCVGTYIVAHHANGQISRYGGWYMTRSTARLGWRVLLPGSQMQLNGDSVVLGYQGCARHIPVALR